MMEILAGASSFWFLLLLLLLPLNQRADGFPRRLMYMVASLLLVYGRSFADVPAVDRGGARGGLLPSSSGRRLSI